MRRTDDTPRLHSDACTARTVVVAPGRADRPNELEGAAIRCPFCPGNESLTPPDLLRAPKNTAEPWRVRIVPNRFPVAIEAAVASPSIQSPAVEGPAPSAGHAPGSPRTAHGTHDCVIESPAHVRSILDIDASSWRTVWELCQERLAMLASRGDIRWATIFKNSGAKAGASLEHVHSQIVGLDFVPPLIESELAAVRRAADPFGDLVSRAVAEERVVDEAGDLIALVPPAPRQPFETWILPRTAEASFHATSRDRVQGLADLTRSLAGRLERLVPGAAFNWWLHQPPHAGPSPVTWHWHLEIMPRINGLAGFELGSGCHITTLTPDESAQRLRDA